MRLKTPPELTAPDLMVPSPVRPRFLQSDLDRLSQNVDDADVKHEKVGELARSDSLEDIRLLTIKRDKEFPNEDAILKVEEKRKAACKVQLGLSQEELDKLRWTSDSETATPDGDQSPGELGSPSNENWEAESDRKCLYVKRERAFGERPTAITEAGIPQDELDAICKDGVSHIIEAAATRSPSLEEVRVSDDEQECVEEEDSVYVKTRKTRTYLKRPHVAPSSGISIGFSQRQLDHIVGYDEADELNVPNDPSSPHGNALNAIKRRNQRSTKDASLLAQRQVNLETVLRNAERELDAAEPQPKRAANQAELDALCVEADDDDDNEEEEEYADVSRQDSKISKRSSSPGKVDSEAIEEEQEWSAWNSPRRSHTSSPRSPHGGRSPSPCHGGA
jgi:hypothetical protein